MEVSMSVLWEAADMRASQIKKRKELTDVLDQLQKQGALWTMAAQAHRERRRGTVAERNSLHSPKRRSNGVETQGQQSREQPSEEAAQTCHTQ